MPNRPLALKYSLLRAHFVARLHRRRAARHFMRHFSFELLRHAPVSKAVSPDLAQGFSTPPPKRPRHCWSA
jgi:hypothetical protein